MKRILFPLLLATVGLAMPTQAFSAPRSEISMSARAPVPVHYRYATACIDPDGLIVLRSRPHLSSIDFQGEAS
jgi:hypothetical protein